MGRATALGTLPPLPCDTPARLLLECSRADLEPWRATRVVELAGKRPDWRRVLELAARHRVLTLLYRHAAALFASQVPPPALEELRSSSHRASLRGAWLSSELLALLRLFEGHGLQAVPLKGPLLAAQVYPDPALRQFEDLDLLVHNRDALVVRDLMCSRGYRPAIGLTGPSQDACLQSGLEQAYTRGAATVEFALSRLTWGARTDFDGEWLWETLEPAEWHGLTVSRLTPEGLLVYLCWHGAKDAWARLQWVCDLAELLRRRQSMDWCEVDHQAARAGTSRMLRVGLILSAALLDAPVPRERLAASLGDPVARQLAAEAVQRLFAESEQVSSYRRHRFHVRSMDGVRRRARHCLRLVAVPSQEDWDYLPHCQPLVRALVRPARVVVKYARAAAGWRR